MALPLSYGPVRICVWFPGVILSDLSSSSSSGPNQQKNNNVFIIRVNVKKDNILVQPSFVEACRCASVPPPDAGEGPLPGPCVCLAELSPR